MYAQVRNLFDEYIGMLQSLEEAIIVVQDGYINFSNDISKDILTKINFRC